MKKWMACLGLMMTLALPASAWRPAGWVYFNWPYAYDHATGDWYYFSPNNVQWSIRHGSAEGWLQLNNSALAQGWSWHTWPYAYSHANASWYNFAAARNHWCINMRTGQWTVFGVPPAPADMAIIPGGTNAGTDPDYGAYSLTVDPFYLDRHEVTQELWTEVDTWAQGHGYSDLSGSGRQSNHPVTRVNWFDCVKWCNARSEREGRTPVYYTDAARTQPYRTGDVVPFLKDTANGYRLPTDTQWEYAARGGVTGRRFPWGTDTIQHTRANYQSSDSYAYDTSATRGYHSTWDYDPMPYTNRVGWFAATGYGLYDMAGNVMEWCYDWHPDFVGTRRVLRGGGWDTSARHCRVSFRYFYDPSVGNYVFGFRTAIQP